MHAIFQRHHRFPGEVWNLPPFERDLVLASMELQLDLEREERLKAGTPDDAD